MNSTSYSASFDNSACPDPSDRSAWYQFRHGQLLKLLERAVEVTEEQRHADKLQMILDKCREDQFNFILLGEFQDGKSTTLDVLCHGREISPQGGGQFPTSAVPLSVESAKFGNAPQGMDEWGELHFKTKKEIAEEVFTAFEGLLRDEESHQAESLKEFAGDSCHFETFCQNFDLENPHHRGVLRDLIEDEWTRYQESKGSFCTGYRQRLAVLTMEVRFYGCPEHEKLRQKTTIPIEKVGDYVYFPPRWGERSVRGFESDISFQESIFALLNNAVLHVKSGILNKLECRITDCPGLGVSAYDSDVTRRALRNADGIWYVKKCEKQFGSADLGRVFDFVRDTGRLDRTGMLLNLWKSHKKSTEPGEDGTCLVDYCKEQLAQDGYSFPMFWGNARLAFLAELGRRKVETKKPFTLAERKRLCTLVSEILEEDVDTLDDDTVWVKAVEAANDIAKVKTVKEIESLDIHSVETLWRASNFEVAIDHMLKIALTQRGQSILVANGTQKGLGILEKHERELQTRVDEAKKTEEEFRADYQKAGEALEKFKKESEVRMEESELLNGEAELSKALAEDFVEELLGENFTDQVSIALAHSIYQNNSKLNGLTESGFRDNVLREWMPIVNDIFKERAEKIIGILWRPSSRNAWVRTFYRRTDLLNHKIERLVEELGKETKLLEKIPAISIDTNKLVPVFHNLVGDALKSVIESLREGFFHGLWSALKWLLGGGIIRLLGLGPTEEDIVKKTSPRIRSELDKALNLFSLRDKLRKSIEPTFVGIHEDALDQVRSGVKSLRDEFEKNRREAEVLHKMAYDEKMHAIEKLETKLKQDITPLRQELQEFEDTVKHELQSMTDWAQ